MIFFKFGDKDFNEILQGTSITFFFKITGLIISYAFNIIFARLYGAKVIGIFAVTIAVSGIFSLLASFGSQTSIVRFIAQFGNKNDWEEVENIYKKYIYILFPIAVFFSVFLFVISPLLSTFVFKNGALLLPFRLIAFIIPVTVFLNINSAALRGLKEISKSNIFKALIPLFNLLILLFLTYFIAKNYLVPIYAQIASFLIIAIISYLFWDKEINERRKENKKIGKGTVSVRNIVKVSFPMLITAGMLYILGWTDTLMLGGFRNETEVGIYRIAIKIALFTSFSLSAVNSIAAPKFSELYWGNNKERLKHAIQNSAQVIFFGSLFILFIIIFFSKEILLLFGTEFIEGQNVLIILSIGQFINAAFGSVGVLLDMTGNQKLFRNAVILGAILNIILNVILIPHYGILGAAIATTISIVIWNFKTAIFAYKIFGYWVGFSPLTLYGKKL